MRSQGTCVKNSMQHKAPKGSSNNTSPPAFSGILNSMAAKHPAKTDKSSARMHFPHWNPSLRTASTPKTIMRKVTDQAVTLRVVDFVIPAYLASTTCITFVERPLPVTMLVAGSPAVNTASSPFLINFLRTTIFMELAIICLVLSSVSPSSG